jgi:hypothetical protein
VMSVLVSNQTHVVVYAILQNKHTSNTHAIAPVQRVPDHGTVRDGDERFRQIFWRRCEGIERDSRTTEDEGLQAR